MKKFLANWMVPFILIGFFVSAGDDYVINQHTIRGVRCRDMGGRLSGYPFTWIDSPCIKTTLTTETLKVD